MSLQSLAASCNAFWQKRGAISDLLEIRKDPELSADLQDIAIFAAGVQAKLCADSGSTAQRDALRILDEAELMFGPSRVLQAERTRQRLVLRMPELPAPTTSATELPPPRTAREHYALGRALLASGDVANATPQLAAAIKLDPVGRWPNFYYGLCAYRGGYYEDAIAAFSVCIGAAPNVAGYYYNRAVAYAALDRFEQALRDYDCALEIDPAHAAAALNRGLLHLARHAYGQAIADLDLALKHGADPATVHYNLALVHMAANETPLALQEARQALDSNPSHEQARQLRQTLERGAR
jgi:tetratricopeptide (TPR) repeat protein